MLADNVTFGDEDEGEAFDFDDSGDDIPEADRLPPAPQNQDKIMASNPEGHLSCPDPPALSNASNTPSSADTTIATSRSSTAGGSTTGADVTSAVEGTDDKEADLPLPPPPPLDDYAETDPGRAGLQPRSVCWL